MPNLKTTHPIFAAWSALWRVAHDVYEGTGGFLAEDRPYLMAHPREWMDHASARPSVPTPKLLARRKLARYENVAEAVVDSVHAPLFRAPRSRVIGRGEQSPDHLLARWWSNADGRGTDIDAVLSDAWVIAAVFGHAVLLMEQPAPDADTAADQMLPRVSLYTPLDMRDWLTDAEGNLTAVRLAEPEPRDSFDTNTNGRERIREVTRAEYVLYDPKGGVIERGPHGFTSLPVVILYAKRRPLIPVIGKSAMGDPLLYMDLYNLTSEVRELLRNQTFAILNIPIGKDGNAGAEMELIGQQSGTTNVLLSTGSAQYVSPQGDNVSVYHDHIDRLVRTVYRLARIPWESDSKDAEASGSLKLKREDLRHVLTRYAAEVYRAEMSLIALVYQSEYGEAWADRLASDGVAVRYPEDFDTPDLDAVIERVASVIGMELGPTATREIKRQIVRVTLPTLDDATRQQIDAEINEMPVDTTADRHRARLALMTGVTRVTPDEEPNEPPPADAEAPTA